MASVEAGVARGGSDGDGNALNAEERLAALARAGGPLRRVMAAIAARWASTKGWERLGYARLSDHARERVGLSGRSVQELARVGRRLEELPGLEAALASGALPWSKVRLLARFVESGDEARWLARARAAPVRALERQLRAVDRGTLEAGALAGDSTGTDEDGRDADPVEHVRIRGPAALCFKWQRTREFASRVEGARIPAGVVVELVTAETLSALPLGDAPEIEDDRHRPCAQREPPMGEEPCVPPPEASPGSAEIPPFLQPLLEGLADADAFELDARLRRAQRLEQRLDAQLAPLLRRIAASEYEWRVRFRTLGEYARERLGMSPRKARALVRLERLGDACPELRRAFRDGRLSWVQAHVLAPLLGLDAEGPWREAWVAHAAHVSVRRLEEQVDDALVAREARPSVWQDHREHPERFGHAGAPGLAPEAANVCANSGAEEGIRLAIPAPRSVARLFRATLCSLRRALERETGRLLSEGEAFEAMLDHALRSWGADDPWLRRRMRRNYRVFERDGWRCTVPGCSARRNLHAHHIVFRSAGGGDELANQTTLCAVHHQRGVHDGRVRIVGRAPDGLRYELGLRPGLPPLERYETGDRRVA